MAIAGRARRLPWLLLWGALSIAVFVVARELPWRRIASVVAGQDPAWGLLAIALNLVILPLWAMEWVRLAPASERPAFRRTFEVVALTSTTLNTVPFFAGEASAVLLLVARAGLSRAGALSLLALDQLLVGIAKLTLIAAAATVAPLPGWLRSGVASLSAIVAGTTLLLVVAASVVPRDRPTTGGRAGRLAVAVRAWASGLDALRDPARAASVLALALLKKSAEVLAVVAAQHALGVTLPWWSAILVVAALGIGTLLPLGPANLGTYEATAFLVYRALGLPADTALGLALVQHLYFLVPAVGTGWLLLAWRQLPMGRAEPTVVDDGLAAAERSTASL